MTRIRISHEWADPKIIDSNITGLNGEPECVDLTIKHNLQRVEFSLTTSDIIALYKALRIGENDG